MFNGEKEGGGRSEDPKGSSYPPAIAQVTLRSVYVYVYRVCVYVGARYYRIILGYFTGAQNKPRTCANSFTDDRYSLAGENKRKRMGDRVLRGFLLCMVWRYNACEGHTLESWARGSSWIIEILAQGVVSRQSSRDCSSTKSIPRAVSIFSSVTTVKVLLIKRNIVCDRKNKTTKDCNYASLNLSLRCHHMKIYIFSSFFRID